MEEGFIPDNGYLSITVAEWYPGKPKYEILGSVKTNSSYGYKIKTYACRQCGFLESYIDVPASP
jgi:hypothetical protein